MYLFQIWDDRKSACRDAAGEQMSEVRSQHVGNPWGKNKKILPKFEELLRTYKKPHIKIPKKFCRNLRSMRFLPYSLPSLLYVDSSPQWSISPVASETPDRSRNPCTVSRPRLRFQNTVHRSQIGCIVDYWSLVHSSTISSFSCLRL